MKKYFAISLPIIFLLNYIQAPLATSHSPLAIHSDSARIEHTIDGSTTEWPDTTFENDKETNISYAVDNDATGLFVAMRIPDFPEQMKIMRMGMKLFIDLKGKKKENMGIEFPVKTTFSPGGGTGTRPAESEVGTEERKFDPQAMRSSMMLNMIFLRIFGIEGQDETQDKGLMMNGSANIAFSWDTADIMHIEYRIPLSMIGEIKSLKDKIISIGWKINGRDNSAAATTSSTQTIGSGSGRRTSGRSGPPPRNPNSSSNINPEDFEKMMKEQSVWTKYSFVFTTEIKGF